MLDFLIGNDLLSAVVAFALVLIPAVLIHELGHFLAAKAVGIAILEFGIGFPPRIAKLFRWGETEFTLNWLPLGGFVRPLGEDMVRQLGEAEAEKERQQLYEQGVLQQEKPKQNPQIVSDDGEVLEITDKPYVDETPEDQARKPKKLMAVHEARPLGRIFFMAAGALANFASAFLIFIVIAMIGIPEIAGGRVAVVNVTPGSQLAQAGLRDGDFIEEVNGQKFATSLDFFVALNSLQDEQATITVRRVGSETPVEITFAPPAAEGQQTESLVRVMGVVEGAPAEMAGILPGDLIVAFNAEPLTVEFSGAPVSVVEHLQALTQEQLGQEVSITLRRGDETVNVSLVPRANPPEGQGAMGIVIQAAFRDIATGVIYQEGPVQRIMVPQPFGEAVQYSANSISYVVGNILRVPGELIRGTMDVETARPVSIIGISQMGGEFLQQSIEEGQPVVILNYMALISVALGLTNLLPIPALDGGRILFVLIEIVRGRPIAPEREGLVHLVGLVLLLSVTVVFILNDLLNPITDLIR